MRLALDLGHGGKDRGAQANGLEEATLNLSLGFLLREFFPELILLRDRDVYQSKIERAAIAAQLGAEAVVSIHHNAGPSLVNRAELYHFGKTPPHPFFTPADTRAISIDSRPHIGPWAYLSRAKHCLELFVVPAVLIEVGYITNKRFAAQHRIDGGQETAQRLAEWIKQLLARELETNETK